MKLSKEAIYEFIEVYLKKKGVKLSFEEASLIASQWLELYQLVKYGKKKKQ